jgi:hypothetical protein
MNTETGLNRKPERLNIVRVSPFGEIRIHAPGGDVDLLLIADPITNGVFAVESSYIDQEREQITSPYAINGDELIIDTKGSIEHIDASRFGKNDATSKQLTDKWPVRELSRIDIEDVAERLDISPDKLNEDVICDIIHSVEKGVDTALENWGEIVRDAIRESVPDKDEDEDE